MNGEPGDPEPPLITAASYGDAGAAIPSVLRRATAGRPPCGGFSPTAPTPRCATRTAGHRSTYAADRPRHADTRGYDEVEALLTGAGV